MLIAPTKMLLEIVTIIGLSINVQVGDHDVPAQAREAFEAAKRAILTGHFTDALDAADAALVIDPEYARRMMPAALRSCC